MLADPRYPVQALRESRRLNEPWLGLVLPRCGNAGYVVRDEAGVGTAVAHVTTTYINLDYKLVAVMVMCWHGAVYGDHG